MKKLLLLLSIILAPLAAMAQEPYAVLSGDKTNLTFYYDDQKEARSGMGVGPFTLSSEHVNSGWDEYRENITSVVFDPSFAGYTSLTSTAYWFYGFTSLETITGVDYLNTVGVTNMNGMFYGCSSLQSLDLSGRIKWRPWVDIITNGDMEGDDVSCFYSRENGSESAPSTFTAGVGVDGSRGIKMTSVAGQANHWDTQFFIRLPKTMEPNARYRLTFYCRASDYARFYTEAHSEPENYIADPMIGTYYIGTEWYRYYYEGVISESQSGNGSMRTIAFDLAMDYEHDIDFYFDNISFEVLDDQTVVSASFDTQKVTDMGNLFFGCYGLKTIYVANDWNTSNVKNSNDMFSGCTQLAGSNGTAYDADHTDCAYARIDGGTDKPGYFTEKVSPVVTKPELYAALNDDNTTLTFYYDGHKDERNGMEIREFAMRWDNENQRDVVNSGWDEHRESITSVVFDPSFADYASLTSTAYWFYGFTNLATVTGISNLNTGNVTNMNCMFYHCSSLTSLDLSGFDTGNVTEMGAMFRNCSSLTSLDVSHFDTSNVWNMSYMFYDCSSLTSLDVSHFNTSRVMYIFGMFSGCSSLTNLDVSGFDTGNVRNMEYMFQNCSSLTSLDVSHFDTSNVRNMYYMFYNCFRLTNLDVSHFNTSRVRYIYGMFSGCSSLTNLDVSGFDTGNVTDMNYMFSGCSGLTSLDVSHFDTGKAVNLSSMFDGCSGLSSLDVSHFDTENVTSMGRMFYGCSGLTSLDLGGLKKKKVRQEPFVDLVTNGNMEGSEIVNFFTKENSDEPLASVIEDGVGKDGSRGIRVHSQAGQVNDWETQFWINLPETLEPNARYRISFDYRSSIDAIIGTEAHGDPGSYIASSIFGTLYPTTEWDNFYEEGTLDERFSGDGTMHSIAFSLASDQMNDVDFFFDNIKFEVLESKEVDVPVFSTSNVVELQRMFFGCSALQTISVAGEWDVSKVQNSSDMFAECTSLVGGSGTAYDADHTDMVYARIDGGTDRPGYFTQKEIPVEDAEPYAVLSSDHSVLTFYYDNQMAARNGMKVGPFTSAGFRGWNEHADAITTVVFDNTFADCASIASTAHWFSSFSSLTKMKGIENLRTENVKSMSGMFASCSSLTSLDVTHFDTGNVTEMYSMFSDCSKLESLDVTHFKTHAVTTMGAMFLNCSSLKSLDLSHFQTGNLQISYSMFLNCSNLTTIYCDDSWYVGASMDMFSGCTSLVGAMPYNEYCVDVTYANPDYGYFTRTKKITVDLAAGWNWMSHYMLVGQSLDGVKEKASRILSQTQELVYDGSCGWVGNLQELAPATLYKVQMDEDASIEMKGGLYTASMGLSVEKGWNWAGYPMSFAANVGDVLAGVEDGDAIIGKTGSAQYVDGQWVGTLVLTPGQGYMYKSVSAKALQLNADATPAASRRTHSQESMFNGQSPDTYRYPDVMAVTARLIGDGENISQDDWSLAAFCDDECRGVAYPVQLTTTNGQEDELLMMNVFGERGHQITFLAMNLLTGEVVEAVPQGADRNGLTFRSDLVGTVRQPCLFWLGTTTGIRIVNGTTSPDSVTVYDLNGRLLKEMPRKRGVYIVTGQQGVNIVVGSDGTRRKVLVK